GCKHTDGDGGVHVPARHGAVCKSKGHDGKTKATAVIPGRPTPLPTTAAALPPMNTKAKVPMNSARSFGAILLDIVDSRGGSGAAWREQACAKQRYADWGWPTARRAPPAGETS